MRDKTDEFSFMLKPSTVCDGVGVFALHDIQEGTKVMVQPDGYSARVLKEEDIPEELRTYCEVFPEGDGRYYCPNDFSHMHFSWYMNHSNSPNVRIEFPERGTSIHYAARDIKAGEELLVDYNEFEEPEDKKDEYYSS